MERLLFYYFHVTSIPVHTLRSCGCRPIQKFQEQMKIKTSMNAMKAERNDLALPAHIWLVFIFLKSTSDQIAHFCGRGRCSREHRRLMTNEIEPAMISFKGILYHPRWRTKLIWFYCQRKLQISLCFLKVPNGWQVVIVEGTYIKKV